MFIRSATAKVEHASPLADKEMRQLSCPTAGTTTKKTLMYTIKEKALLEDGGRSKDNGRAAKSHKADSSESPSIKQKMISINSTGPVLRPYFAYSTRSSLHRLQYLTDDACWLVGGGKCKWK